MAACRVLPLDTSELTQQLTAESLDEAWTVEQTLQLLLLAASLPEAVWLAHQLSDWKTAVMLGAAVQKHQKMSPMLYKR